MDIVATLRFFLPEDEAHQSRAVFAAVIAAAGKLVSGKSATLSVTKKFLWWEYVSKKGVNLESLLSLSKLTLSRRSPCLSISIPCDSGIACGEALVSMHRSPGSGKLRDIVMISMEFDMPQDEGPALKLKGEMVRSFREILGCIQSPALYAYVGIGSYGFERARVIHVDGKPVQVFSMLGAQKIGQQGLRSLSIEDDTKVARLVLTKKADAPDAWESFAPSQWKPGARGSRGQV